MIRPAVRRGLVAVGAAAALVGAVAGSAVASEHQRPKPTARQLWQEYPLHTRAPKHRGHASTGGAEAKPPAARPHAISTSSASEAKARSGSDVQHLVLTTLACALAGLVLTFAAIRGGGSVAAAFARSVHVSTGAARRAGAVATAVPWSTLFWCLAGGVVSAGIGIVAVLLTGGA
jgi:hypothetical protein